MSRTILFLCPHNAAKSVMAAALCSREAATRGIDLRVDSAGTEPDPAPATKVVALLAAEGLDVARHCPRSVTEADLSGAWRVVSMGCELPQSAPPGPSIEYWSDIPAPSVDLAGARERIGSRVKELLEGIPERGCDRRSG